MNNKKILTIDDLYNFYSKKKKSMSFSSDKEGYNLAVQVNGKFEIKNDDDSEGLLYADVRAFHDLGNRNKSYIDTEVLKEKMMSMKDRPIMADIIETEEEDDNGNKIKDFNGHTMTYNEELDKIEYIEHPVGHFINPENFTLEYDDEYKRHFVNAECVVYEEYTDACDILRRRGTVDCSVELCIRDLAYNAKTGEMILNDFYVQGCTLLGSHVSPGMAGSRVTLKDFSESNNSVFSSLNEDDKNKLVEMRETIDNMLSRFDIYADDNISVEKYGKEEINVVMESTKVIEEVVENEGTVITDVESTDTTELNDVVENEDTVIVNEDDESTEEVTETDDNDDADEVSEDTVSEDEVSDEDENDEDDDADEEDTVVESTPEDNETDEDEDETESFEVIEKTFEIDGKIFSVKFELSHDEIRYGLYHLLGQYEELDNDWYDIKKVYDDYFIMEGWCTGKLYGQKYLVDGDAVTLEGERYELYCEYLTASEKAEVESMRSNYSLVTEKLAKYEKAELDAQKNNILSDANYVEFTETDSFKEIRKNIENYSLDELKTACELAFAKEVKARGTFALNEGKTQKSNVFSFGTIEQKSSFLDGLLGK